MKLSRILPGSDIPQSVLSHFADFDITGVTSRLEEVTAGTLFVAVDGANFSGSRHIPEAARAGAVCAVSSSFVEEPSIPVLITKDTRSFLSLAAKHFFGDSSDRLRLFGVTGTNGKTSVAHLLHFILEKGGLSSGLIGTVENILPGSTSPSTMTTPEPIHLHSFFSSLEERGGNCAVMEVSSQALDQKRVDFISFESAIFTNISAEHLDYHRTLDAYISAKKRLTEKAERCIINSDDASLSDFSSPRCNIYYSLKKGHGDFFAENVTEQKDGISFSLSFPGGCEDVLLKTRGIFSVYNALAATAAAVTAGIPDDTVLSALSEFEGVSGRMECLKTDAPFSVMIDFAHTPDALYQLLCSARSFTRGRIILVFGCGGDRDRSKRPLMGRIAAENADMVFITSDNPRSEDPFSIIENICLGAVQGKARCLAVADRKEAIRSALSAAREGDTVIVAGKGHEKYQIIGKNKFPFDEKEIILNFLSKRPGPR